MHNLFKLLRPKHWIKNLLVLLPLLCSGQVLQHDRLIPGILAFFAFSLLASSIYIINDVRDRENDRKNPSKCSRPIASGAVSISSAMLLFIAVLALALVCGGFANGTRVLCWVIFLLYFFLNLIYSFGGKNVPLLDIAILSFVIYKLLWMLRKTSSGRVLRGVLMLLLAMVLSLLSPWLALLVTLCGMAVSYTQACGLLSAVTGRTDAQLLPAKMLLVALALALTLIVGGMVGGLLMRGVLQRVMVLLNSVGSLI